MSSSWGNTDPNFRRSDSGFEIGQAYNRASFFSSLFPPHA
jgi:hypothetical protein